jgi:hypothetical protein
LATRESDRRYRPTELCGHKGVFGNGLHQLRCTVEGM